MPRELDRFTPRPWAGQRRGGWPAQSRASGLVVTRLWQISAS